MMMKHLRGGVRKGAFTEEEATRRFQAWKDAKDKKVAQAKAKIDAANQELAKSRFEAEVAVNRAKAEAIAKKKAEILAAKEAEAKAAAEAEAAAKAEEEAAAAPEAAEAAPEAAAE